MIESPFLERAGVKEPAFLEVLAQQPDKLLSPEQAERVTSFAQDLFKGQFEDMSVDLSEKLDMADIEKIPTDRAIQTFVIEYFNTPEGQADADLLGLEEGDNIRDYVTDISVTKEVDAKIFRQVAVRSSMWQDRQVEQRLLSVASENDHTFSEAESVSTSLDPSIILKKFDALQKYRRFFKQVYERLNMQEDDFERAAKLDLTKMYAGRVTESIGSLYAAIVTIVEQINQHPELEAYDDYGKRLEQIAPVIIEALLNNETEEGFYDTIDRFHRRLDYVRNGAAISEDGLTPIAPEIMAIMSEETSRQNIDQPAFPPEVVEMLKRTIWDAWQTQWLAQSVLRKLGQLSNIDSDAAEVSRRDGPAVDNKYQVIVDPEQKTSLSVNTFKKVVYIGSEFSRGLIDTYPAWALPGVAHEVLHVLQGLVDEEMSQTLPLAAVKGRRYLSVREGGGIAIEKTLQRTYFGQDRKANQYYTLALQTKLAGKNRLEVARAFYNAMLEDTDLSKLDEAEKAHKLARVAQTAVDRSARLYRHRGHNSQPLNYVEQDLIARKLNSLSDSDRNKLLLRLGSFNVQDAATLHRYGLYPTATSFDDISLPELVLETFFEEFNSIEMK